MKIALIMNDNSYPGREYMKALVKHHISVDVINIGSFQEIDNMEEERCGGLWRPPLLAEICDTSCIHSFSSLQDERLLEFLEEKQYDIAVQGGTGILKNAVIRRFREGILNFHPGDLPEYRGCSAPEWQLWENRSVICTCHLVDEMIDHGPIYQKKILDINYESYNGMRASVYPEIAKFVAEVLKDIPQNIRGYCIGQDESRAMYRPYIGDERIMSLAERMRIAMLKNCIWQMSAGGGGRLSAYGRQSLRK